MQLTRSRKLMLLGNVLTRLLIRKPKTYRMWDDRESLDVAEPVYINWPSGIGKPTVGLVRERCWEPYWTKYERFLHNNGFHFGYVEIHGSQWQEEVQKYDVILWKPMSKPANLDEARRKIHILEHYLGKLSYPDFKTIMLYENKLLLYAIMISLGIPVVPAFISHDYTEVLASIPQLCYPLVSKTNVGASSHGVELVKSPRAAYRLARQAFCRSGRPTYFLHDRQKDYVYWQRFQENEGYDLRVIVVGDYLFGYYRDVPRGEFRASGMNLVRREALPEDAMRLALEISDKIDLVMVAVDMLRDPRDGSLHVIELSPYYRIEDAEQLRVNCVPGVYVHNDGRFTFQAGRFWPQELALQEFFRRRWLKMMPTTPHP